MKKRKNIRNIIIVSILISFSVVLSLVDKYISSGIIVLFPLIGTMVPNFKIGLANIVILIIILNYGFKLGFLAVLLKVLIVGLFNPNGIIMSFGGSFLSFFVMVTLIKLLGKEKHICFVSGIGGFSHSLGQIIFGFLYYGLIDIKKIFLNGHIDLDVLIYSPAILIFGLITGLLIGQIVKVTNQYVKNKIIISQNKKKEGNKMNTIYVAHRGSKVNGGVENTQEAFLGGVKAGAQALECDVRVTKDGTYIIFHDNTLERLTKESQKKYTLDVNQEIYDVIKNIELTQNYRDNCYKGNICLFETYLDICKEGNVIPIIELKWTNGIYSGDENNYNYANLDQLVTLVRQHGLFDTAYIMTSMRGCLEYLRKKYPTIKLQWLCSTNVLDHIDWAIENNINIDVEYNSCTKEIVDKCHNNNLIVNIWTMNDESLLSKYLEMNVDMITTDWIIK